MKDVSVLLDNIGWVAVAPSHLKYSWECSECRFWAHVRTKYGHAINCPFFLNIYSPTPKQVLKWLLVGKV